MGNITIKNLSFRYEDSSKNVFNDLNLNLDSSWKLGLVGRNGRGKTTFLNLLRGKLQGLGTIQSKLNFGYFPINIKNSDEITLYELQSQVDFEEWQLRRELNLMGIDPDIVWQPFNTLSGGEQTKVLLALAFVDQDSFSLIDEPTNHLDENSRKEIARYLRKQKSGYIVVSHDRDFLNKVTDHILAIENTEIHLYQGNYAAYEDTKDKRDAFNEAKNEKLRSEIKRLNHVRVQFNNWSQSIEAEKNIGQKTQNIINHRTQLNKGFIGHKSAKMMKKSMNTERRMDKKIAAKKDLVVNIEKAPDLKMNFIPKYHHTLLEIKDLALSVDNRKLFSNLNLVVKNQGVTALEGKNGSGKSTLLRLLLGDAADITQSGQIMLANGLKISYLSQIFSQQHGTLKEFAEKEKLDYTLLLNTLNKMGILRSNFSTPIEEMSMGQQKRVAIAKSLVEPADLYLWDEPANYLDVFNQNQLIKLLKNLQPAMLLVEHDKYFIEQVASERISLNN